MTRLAAGVCVALGARAASAGRTGGDGATHEILVGGHGRHLVRFDAAEGDLGIAVDRRRSSRGSKSCQSGGVRLLVRRQLAWLHLFAAAVVGLGGARRLIAVMFLCRSLTLNRI